MKRIAIPVLAALSLSAPIRLLPAAANGAGSDCTFRNSPDDFLSAQSRVRESVFDRTKAYRFAVAPSGGTVSPESVERRNFVDDEVFGKMAAAGVRSAPVSSDEEFLRRVTLDLTGRLPAPAAVRAFLADTSANKRDAVIDTLLASPEFTDKWAMWMGDWLRNSPTNSTSYSPGQLAGRNAFYKYIWMAVASDKSLREMTYEILSAAGNNFDEPSPAGFLSSTGAPGGPAQDTYDAMLVKSATTFLGLGHYDCVLCHNGRGHLNQLSLWATGVNRQDAQKMAAFFARTNLVRWTPPPGQPNDNTQFYFNSYYLQDVVNRTYDLNTNFGNRPNRVSVGATVRLSPEYRESGAKPGGEAWRTWFAAMILDDPMFAKNFVNRVWKQMFNMAIVEPVDGLDPLRLDPANPPPDPWTFQATHPELLAQLATEFTARGYSLRRLLKTIAGSSAYQISSRYDDQWKIDYVPLFARHYPRRLDGEEVHDILCAGTGVFNKYTQFNWGDTVSYAMQLLDPAEPRSNGGAAAFMNYFFRGNRDTTSRSQTASVQQGLALMNDSFVTARLKVAASPILSAASKLPTNDAVIEELFLRFLSRLPTDYERTRAQSYLSKATTAAQKNATIEDLAWSLVNKIEFLFSY